MLFVLSPAKTLDYESPPATKKFTEPELIDHSAELIDVMRQKSPADLRQMMSISDDLAEINFERFQDWRPKFTAENSKAAVLAFQGDVYQGLDVGTFGERDFTRSQRMLRILSGLYGILRPLDLMQPYRLEMGSKLQTDRGRNLYEFWGNTITERLETAIEESPGQKVLINTASNEYFKSVKPDLLNVDVVTPSFLDASKEGKYRTVSFFAKRARGAIVGWAIRNRVEKVAELADFDGMGYQYDVAESTDLQPVFKR